MKQALSTDNPVILCLVNAAAYSRAYFQQLEPHLNSLGYRVVYALDSHLSDVLYADGSPLTQAAYFTDYCRSQLPLPTSFTQDNSPEGWSLLFSDFDRFLTMGIHPPLSAEGELRYEHIPGLLNKFFTRQFDAHKPVAVVYEQASNSFALAALKICQQRGIPFCSLAPSRIPGRIEISTTGAIGDWKILSENRKKAKLRKIKTSSWSIAEKYIKEIDTATPDYMKQGQSGEMLSRLSLIDRYAKLEKLQHIARAWRYKKNYPTDMKLAYQHGDPIHLSWSYFRRSLTRRIRAHYVQRFYNNAPKDCEFFVYPLHFHPEASTSVLAPDFINEMHVIKSIAFRLPTNIRLVVKEHPSAIALQSIEFYKQLSILPNVDLVAANISAKKLARDSIGVICVTSTLGLEAAAMKKPVIALGDVMYGYFPNVRMIRDLSAVTDAINWAIDFTGVSDQEVLEGVAAYAEFTAAGSFDFRTSLGNSEAIKNVASVLHDRLKQEISIQP